MTEIKTEIDFVEMEQDIACIKQAVMGNGEPGLCHRVDTLEKAQKKQGWVNGFFAGIGFVVGGCVNLLIALIRGG